MSRLADAGGACIGAGLPDCVAAGLPGAGVATGLATGGGGAEAGGLSWVGVWAAADDINPPHRAKLTTPAAMRPTVLMPPSQQLPAVGPRPRPLRRRRAQHRTRNRPPRRNRRRPRQAARPRKAPPQIRSREFRILRPPPPPAARSLRRRGGCRSRQARRT